MCSLHGKRHGFSPGETQGQCPYRVKVQKCTMTSWKDWLHMLHNRGEREDVFLKHYPFSIASIFSLSFGYFSCLFFFFCLYPSCLQAVTTHTVDLMCLCLTIVSVSPWHTAHCFPSLQHRVKYPSSIHLNHMARSH